MVNLTDIRNEVSKYTYKPNTQIRVMDFGYTVEIVLSVPIIEVSTGIQRENVYSTRFSDRIIPDELLDTNYKEVVKHHIEKMIRDHENHEIQEWFMYDGQTVYNPHPELQ